MIVTYHKLHLTGEIGLYIAFQLDYLYEVDRFFIIFYIVTPGGLVFFYQFTHLFRLSIKDE